MKPVDTRPEQPIIMQYSQHKEQHTLLHNHVPITPSSATKTQSKPLWEANTHNKPIMCGKTTHNDGGEKSPTFNRRPKPQTANSMFTAPKESTPKDVIDDVEHGVINESFEESPTHRPRGGRGYDENLAKYPPRDDERVKDRGREARNDHRHRDASHGRDGYNTHDRKHRDNDRHRDRSKGRDHSRGRDLDYSRGRDRSKGQYDGSHSRDSSYSRLHKKQSFEDFNTLDYLSGKPLDTSLYKRRDDSHSTIRNNVSDDDVFYREGHRRSKSSGRYRGRNRSRSRDGEHRRSYDDHDIDRPHKHDYSSSDNRSRSRHHDRYDNRKPGHGRTSSRHRQRSRRNSNDTTATDLMPYSPVATLATPEGNHNRMNIISPAMTININAHAGSAVHLALGANKGVASGVELPRLKIEQLHPSSSASGENN